jgi:hypothetical protein
VEEPGIPEGSEKAMPQNRPKDKSAEEKLMIVIDAETVPKNNLAPSCA